jgi:TPR repeat protein
MSGIEGLFPADTSKAFSLLSSLENSFIAEALFDLAYCYDTGEGVPDDEEKAFCLYMNSALLGDKESCEQVSEFFLEGKLVPQSDSVAEAWHKRAELSDQERSPPHRVMIRPFGKELSS